MESISNTLFHWLGQMAEESSIKNNMSSYDYEIRNKARLNSTFAKLTSAKYPYTNVEPAVV